MISKSLKLQGAAGLAAVTLMSTMVMQSSRAAFTDTTSHAGNWDSGKVKLSESSTATLAFTNTANMVPGDSNVACISVAFTGDVASHVKLHASTTGTLGSYLNLTIDEVPASTTSAGCATATPVTGGNLVTTGTLAAFDTARSSFTDGLDNLNAGAAWTPSAAATKMYRLKVTLQDTNDAQNQAGAATFTWEAQNT